MLTSEMFMIVVGVTVQAYGGISWILRWLVNFITIFLWHDMPAQMPPLPPPLLPLMHRRPLGRSWL